MSGLAGGHLGDLVAALVDDQLSPANRELVLRHLAGCEACRAEVHQERLLKSRLRALSAPGLPESLLGRLAALSMPQGSAPVASVGEVACVSEVVSMGEKTLVVAPPIAAADSAAVRASTSRDARRGRLLAGAASLLLVGVGAAYTAAADAAQSTTPAHPAFNSLSDQRNVATTTSVMLNDPAFEAMTASYSR